MTITNTVIFINLKAFSSQINSKQRPKKPNQSNRLDPNIFTSITRDPSNGEQKT